MLADDAGSEVESYVKYDEAVKNSNSNSGQTEIFRHPIDIETQGKQMKIQQRYAKPLMWLSALLMTALVAGCGGGSDQGRDPILGLSSLISIAVTPATATLPIGGIQPFTAIATYNDGSTSDVTKSSSWTSGTTSVATVNSTSGIATGVAKGASVITANFGGKSGSGNLTVTTATLASIAVTPATATVPIDGIQPFMAVATYSDGSTSDVTVSSRWTSGTTSVATVNSSSGVADGIASGTSVITANFGGKSSSGSLTVTTATLASIAVTPATASVRIGGIQPFTATAAYSDGSSRDVTPFSSWTSGTASVATVNSSSGVAKGVATGQSQITASFRRMSGSGALTVIVAAGPAPVLLGTAGNFVILAKSAISTTGTTAVTGDIGVSPAAASYITGFSLTADPSNVFSTSPLVTGKIFAANYAVPTPNNLTTAVNDMETAFTDAAGRPTPDFTELYAGDISGKTLAPGLYKWGTGVLITGAGVTLSGGPNDVWIFQVAQDLTVSNSAIVTLSGGAQAKNIFWQVSGEATLGTAANFKGNILSQTLISLNTGAAMTGRALAQTAVTLNATSISQP
ncbi:MAG: DUF3494 domain-containing protein [Glaciimonas sp.]|nr:DUF3494 domain-containing protein [Glaciimonas sp.]